MRDKESFLKQFALLEPRIPKIEKTTRKGIDNYTLYVDTAMCLQWKTQVVTLLRQIYPLRLFPQWLNKEDIASSRKTNFRVAVGIFNAAYEDFKNGLLDDLQAEIECGVAVDYLQQAEALLKNPCEVDHAHIPAAVLTGAVLEKSLRTLCLKQNPSIDVDNETANPRKRNGF